MMHYVVHKVLHTALVAFGVVTLVFVALRLSGDPAATMLPGDASVDELAALRRELGLDQPLHVQYLKFLAAAVTGDFGTSLRHQQPAFGLVIERLPATLELAFAALLLAVVVALPLGIIAAIYRGRLADMLAMGFAVVGQATPYFWMGIMLILIFAVELQWVPTSGRGGFDRLILPAVTLGTHFMAVLARLTRTSMLEVLGQNYVTTARAKGLPEWLVITTHALKNAAVPVVTLIGLQFGTLLGGAVVTETIFAWPGVGRLAVQSIFVRDYPVVQAGVFVLALSFVGINLLIDLLYGYLDPRIRSDEAPAPPSRRHRRMVWALIVPAVPVIIAIGVAVLAPWIAPHSPTSGRLAARLQPPVWQEGGNVTRLLGSDLLGRDVLSRLFWGARISLLIALLATLLGAAVGSLIGLVTGYYRGRVDRVITKLIDIQLAFPFVLLAIAVIAVAGPSIPVLVIVLAIGSWVGHARIVRGLVLSLREREYVQAALALGAGTPRVLFRHLVPEILSLILVMATFDVGRIIILESTLSFLGLGVQPPTPSWGSDLRDAAIYVRQAWWMATFPGLAIMLVVLGVNLLGDALRDVLDPRTKKN